MPNIRADNPIHLARSELVKFIENLAVREKKSMTDAVRIVVKDKRYFAMVLAACGQWYTGHPPSVRVVRKWYDGRKLALASRWPNLSPQELIEASPYLPIKKRPKPTPTWVQNKRYAEYYLGKGISREEVSESLGISMKTLYRWVPAATVPALLRKHRE